MCGVGLKLSLKSIQQNEESTLLQDTSIGALNGLISSIGMVCIAQNECNGHLYDDSSDGIVAPQVLASYALTGLITGTINGTINEVISCTQSETEVDQYGHSKSVQNEGDIQLLNVTKSGVMEMGSNLFTALGKATIFKSAADSEESQRNQFGSRGTQKMYFRVHPTFQLPSYRQKSSLKVFRFQRDRLRKSLWMDVA